MSTELTGRGCIERETIRATDGRTWIFPRETINLELSLTRVRRDFGPQMMNASNLPIEKGDYNAAREDHGTGTLSEISCFC